MIVRLEAIQKSKILIIEDDPMLQKLYSDKLTIEGYEVDLAKDGQEGLNKALNNNPDLVLLDINLPKISGWYILDELKKTPRTHKTPVIILSNRGKEEEIERGIKLKADDYIVKVFSTPMHVVEKIQKHLSKRKVLKNSIIGLARYRINIQTSQSDARQLAHDFAFNTSYSCNPCRTQLVLEIVHDHTFPGPGNRFLAQFICTKCGGIY